MDSQKLFIGRLQARAARIERGYRGRFIPKTLYAVIHRISRQRFSTTVIKSIFTCRSASEVHEGSAGLDVTNIAVVLRRDSQTRWIEFGRKENQPSSSEYPGLVYVNFHGLSKVYDHRSRVDELLRLSEAGTRPQHFRRCATLLVAI